MKVSIPPALLFVVSILLAAGCGGEEGGPDGSGAAPGKRTETASGETEELYRLRNRAKLEADRDSEEGYRAAADLLAQVVARSPETFTDRLNLARALVFTERAGEAGPEIEAAFARLGDRPAPPELEYVAGIHANRIDDRESALTHFTRVTGLRPDLVHGWYQRGYAEERLQRLEEAVSSYSRALELAPEHRAAAYRLVIVLRQLGRPEQEKVAYERFQSLPQGTQPDPEKCDLAMVSLVPLDRADSEPPTSEVRWTEVGEEMSGSYLGLRGVVESVPEGAGAGRQGAGSGTGVGTGSGAAGSAEGSGDPAGAGTASVRGSESAEGIDLVLLTEDGLLALRRSASGIVGRRAFRDGAARGAESLVMGDLDNDGAADVVTTGPAGVAVRFAQPDGTYAGGRETFEAIVRMRGTRVADLDHDGDLDLVGLSTQDGRPGWSRNNGDRTFTGFRALEIESPSDPDALRGGLDFDLGDFDQGSDLDLVVTGPAGTVALLNLRDGRFRAVPLAALGPRELVRAADLDNDGAPDLLAAGGAAGGWVLAPNADREGRPGRLSLAEVLASGELPARPLALELEDLDNDADLDVVFATEEGLFRLDNRDGGRLAVAPAPEVEGPVRSVSFTDADDDGRVELWAGVAAGSRVWEVENERGYAAWRVRPKGARDNRDAIGTTVAQFAGTLYQSRLVRAPRGVRLGLGPHPVTELDGVRMRWPQGILQSETRDELVLAGPREFRPTQDEGLVASCPFLYGDGPDGWAFLTDVVGIAPLDEWRPEGATPHFDPEEYVRIEGAALTVRGGRVRLAITEELRETTYLDRVELVVVDHPASRTLHLDESSRQGAYDPLRVQVFETAELRAPLEVRLEDGSDVTDRIRERDRIYAHGYDEAPSQWSGWVERYALELVAPPGSRTLLLTGRIGWYDSTVSYALHQHGRTWGPLRLDGRVGGEWVPLLPDLGVPAGMDRTLVAAWDEPGVTSLRLSGQHRFLWDRLLFAPVPELVDLGDGGPGSSVGARREGARSRGSEGPTERGERTSLADRAAVEGPGSDGMGVRLASGEAVASLRRSPVRADLGYHGFSPMVGDRARHEQTYRYAEARPEDSYAPAWGAATRYGDVLPLLGAHDDRVVVLVAGDRVELEFEVPEPAAGDSSRTYFLRISGWAKEGSFHNRTGRWIEPLPFRDMESYPPDEARRPSDPEYREYLETWQTRWVGVGLE